MDAGTLVLLVVVGLLGLNQVVVRFPALLRRDAVFFGMLMVLLFAGTVILQRGLPGFEDLPAVSWVVGLMFFLHIAQNLALRNRLLARADAEVVSSRDERAEALRAMLTDDPSFEE